MTNDEKQKCFKLQCQSKQGFTLREDDFKFLQAMWEKYPEEYRELRKEVFDATKPFGAQ